MTRLHRSGRGLWGVAILAAAVVPGFLHVASLHQAYWGGSLGIDFWHEPARVWTARIWAVLGVVALAGFSSTAAAPGVRTVVGRLGAGAFGAAIGVGVWAVASAPGLVWLARLGVEGVPFAFGIAGLAIVAASVVAGALGAWWGGAPAAGGGLVAGLGVLALSWGSLG